MIFSFLAFLFLILSICIKNREKSLKLQTINCFFELLYNYTLESYTMVILSFFNVIRSSIFIRKKHIKKFMYIIVLIIFETIIIFNCILTWSGVITLVPSIASFFRTYSLWQSKMSLVRISGIISGIFYAFYYLCQNSYILVLGYLILAVVSIVAVYKYDIKNKVLK